MTTVFHCRPDQKLLNIKDSRRRQVLNGAVQRADQFTCILSNCLYVRVPLEFSGPIVFQGTVVSRGTSVYCGPRGDDGI